VGGIKYTVQHGITGLLVPPRDPHQLAAALGRLLTDPQRRQAMGSRALARVRQSFTWERVAERLSSIYAETLSATAPAPAVFTAPKLVDLSAPSRQGVS
jgi:glycosyltransferase involved in cell wall biosynthesis